MTSLPVVQERLRSPLPGLAAHNLMAAEPALPQKSNKPRDAAVLMLLTPRGYRVPEHFGDLLVTLIRRADSRYHSRELAFPGGLREGNETPVETALREANEEISLDPERVRILGELSPITTATSGAQIRPILAMTRFFPELFPNEEVDSILHVPLRTLIRPGARGLKVVEHSDLGRRSVPYFLVGTEELWGASAQIMAELLTLIWGEKILR